MRKAEQRALEAYPDLEPPTFDETYPRILFTRNTERHAYTEGYEQAEKDTIVEVEKWLKANFHHRNCWNADEFCISLRAYFGIKK